jgi:hypothetical protein
MLQPPSQDVLVYQPSNVVACMPPVAVADDNNGLTFSRPATSHEEVLDPFLLYHLNQPPLEEFPTFGSTTEATNFEELFSSG